MNNLQTSLDKATKPYVKHEHYSDVAATIITDIDSVDMTLKIMDQRYKTSFYEWIMNADNVDYIAQHLKPLAQEYSMTDGNASVARTIATISRNWNTQQVASLLIKMFYEDGLDKSSFSSMMSHLQRLMRPDDFVDLVATLLIGESADMSARFLCGVAKSCVSPLQVQAVCMVNVAVRSKWSAQYLQDFSHHASLILLTYDGAIPFLSAINELHRDTMPSLIAAEIASQTVVSQFFQLTQNLLHAASQQTMPVDSSPLQSTSVHLQISTLSMAAASGEATAMNLQSLSPKSQ